MDSPPASPIVWQDGAPRSAVYGDIYYSLQDGLAESRAVFLEGCGLPDAWSDRRHFTVAELGFGTGLNIAALLDLWRRTRPKGGRLSIFSIEAHPMAGEDAARALAAWPEISEAAAALIDRWPGSRRGFHRVDLPEFDAVLDLAVGEVGEALGQWSGGADAWFLDGFSPAANPAMWRDEVLALIAPRSAPGARAATFTVAGQVRRGLSAAGFTIEKRPGHGRKRERLEARLPGAASTPLSPGIAIVGAGIAAASLARAFAAQGAKVAVFGRVGPSAASGNPAALVTPAFDAGGGPRAGFYAAAFARATALYRDLGATISNGAVQVEAEARDAARFDRVALQDIFEPGAIVRLTADAVAAAVHEAPQAGGLALNEGLVVEPAVILSAWLGGHGPTEVTAIERAGAGWRLRLADGATAFADVVVLAGGSETTALMPLPLAPVRGQASLAVAINPGPACAFGGYAIPTRDGVLFGATHDRGRTDTDPDPADHARNLAALALRRPNLARALTGVPLEARVGIRAATPDRMPLAGRVEDGLYVLSGLGSRGFTTAPLLAEHVAAAVLGLPSPLARDLAALVESTRFSTTPL